MGAPRVSEPRGPGEKSRGHPIVSEGFFPRIKDALFQLNILQTVVFSDHTHAVCREELTRPGLVMQTSGER